MNISEENQTNRIRQIVNLPSNKPLVDKIIVKMGKLLAKKQILSEQRPILVYEDRIWVGNYHFANNAQFIAENNIKTIISCLDLNLSLTVPDVQYHKFSVKDRKDDTFEQKVIQFCQFVEKTKGNIFVHCFAGKSRSVSFVIAYMMKKQKMNFLSAKEKLLFKYPLGDPNSYFVETLTNMQDKLMKQENQPSENLLEFEPKRQELIDFVDNSDKNDKQNFSEEPKQNNNLIQIDETPSSTKKFSHQEQLITSPTKGQNLLDIDEPSAKVEEPVSIQKNNVHEQILSPSSKKKQSQQKEVNLLEKTPSESKEIEAKSVVTVTTEETTLLDFDEPPKKEESEPISQDLLSFQNQNEKVEEKKSYLLDIQAEKEELVRPQPLDKEESLVQQTTFTNPKKKKNKKKRK